MLDHEATPQGRSGLAQQEEGRSSSGEQVAREVIEQGCGRRLTDGEWAKQRRRLIEFTLTLARWDKGQRQRGEPANIDSDLEASDQALGDKEACIQSTNRTERGYLRSGKQQGTGARRLLNPCPTGTFAQLCKDAGHGHPAGIC